MIPLSCPAQSSPRPLAGHRTAQHFVTRVTGVLIISIPESWLVGMTCPISPWGIAFLLLYQILF
jgi:hypothetical protein